MWVDETRHYGLPDFAAAHPPHTTKTRWTSYWWHFDSKSKDYLRNASVRGDRSEGKVLNGARMKAEIKNNFPVISGKVGNKNVDV